ncbi:arsinothricin resistance N-acetyltransferase ArsN1 family B [Haladaptatus pallidirubidus]|uniref:GNAT family N-acetyltransferase n=1 Tax=Haladaptatus pallidirubidus TaxID=1008152 RepID=A0AAV3UB07_9EURY|nr:arsinothricin resistance N-acetyltransferase ArsN1 family B [Haladaptatus pallidirubidus]
MTTIRLAEADDASQIATIYAPVVDDTIISFETTPPDDEEMANRIRKTLPKYPWIVCELENEILGYAYAASHRTRDAYQWSVDVSVYVHENHRRSGIGSGLYESLFELLRAQGFYNAYAGIALPNPTSVGLHESLGFEPVGVYEAVGHKHGAWHDVGWWHLRLDTPADSSKSPASSDPPGLPESSEPPELPKQPKPPKPLSALAAEEIDDGIERGLNSMRIS